MGKTEKKERVIFSILITVSFIMFLIYNIVTPLMSDDLLFDKSIYRTVWDLFKNEYVRYHTWNGRSVLQIIMSIFTLAPKWIFNICNSLCFVGLSLLVYINVEKRKKYDCFLYVLIQLLIWNFCVDFSQTMLWLSGACNYLWGVVIILGFITLYRYYLQKGEDIGNKVRAGILLFVTGVLAGWGNENTSGGAILLLLLFTLKYFLEHKKVEKVMFSGLAGAFIGFGFLLMAPGNKVRGEIVQAAETYTGLAAYISRGLKLLKAVDEYFMVYIVVICLLGAYFYYSKKYSLLEFDKVAMFAFSGLATAAVLIFTPEPMPRAYFGANIYMMIAVLEMVQKIREDDVLLMSLKTGGIIAASVAMVFLYVEEGANLVRSLREYSTREAYILEQTSKGKKELVLPMMREEFATRFSFLHENDISNEEENWNNEIYKQVYGIESFIAVPWDEWEESLN